MHLNSEMAGGSELQEAEIFVSLFLLIVTTHPGEMEYWPEGGTCHVVSTQRVFVV